MTSFQLQILTTIAIITVILLFDKVLSMKLSFPFSKMTMKSKLYYKLNVKLNCDEMYKNIRECSEQCYFKGKHGSGCLGFVKNKTKNNCYICHPALCPTLWLLTTRGRERGRAQV